MFMESLLALFNHILFILMGTAGIGFLIGFHELGHFLFCKLFYIATPSFSIGFGPKLIYKKIGNTQFSLSLLPYGGYVEIAGATEPGQGDQKQAYSTDQYSFVVKPFYQKLLVLLGGIAFNLFFAYLVITSLFFTTPQSPLLFPLNVRPVITTLSEDSAAAKYGIRQGDRLLSVEGTSLDNSVYTLNHLIQKRPGTPTSITIERDHTIIELSVTPDGIPSPTSQETIGTLGIKGTDYQSVTHFSPLQSLVNGITLTNSYIIGTARGLISIISNRSIKGLGGPLMIISLSSKKAAEGLTDFFMLLAIISINLALLNLIPLPIFDGGQILFYSLEALTGRPLSPVIREYIALVTWFLVMLLFIYISIRDLALITSPLITFFMRS